MIPVFVGPDIVVSLGVMLRGKLDLMGTLGPGKVRGITLLLNPITGVYAGTGSFYAAAALGPRLMLSAAVGAQIATVIPVDDVPVPVILGAEGGFRGTGRASALGAVQATVALTYSGGRLTFAATPQLMVGLFLRGDLDGYVGLSLEEKLICQQDVWAPRRLERWAWLPGFLSPRRQRRQRGPHVQPRPRQPRRDPSQVDRERHPRDAPGHGLPRRGAAYRRAVRGVASSPRLLCRSGARDGRSGLAGGSNKCNGPPVGSGGCTGSEKKGYKKWCTYACPDGSKCETYVRCTWSGDDPKCPESCYKSSGVDPLDVGSAHRWVPCRSVQDR